MMWGRSLTGPASVHPHVRGPPPTRRRAGSAGRAGGKARRLRAFPPFRRARLTPHRRCHCWTNAAGIASRGDPVAAPIPTKASQLLAPGVGTVGHPPAGALLKMIAALAPAWVATE